MVTMHIKQSYGPHRSRSAQVAALAAAAIIVVMLLGQLFGFEDFASVLGTVMPFNDMPLSSTLAAGLVLVELLALPYLLAMYLSPLMRALSATAALAVALFWLIVCLTNAHASNIGMLSSTFTIHGGLVAVAIAFVLFVLILRVVLHDSKFRHVGPTS